MRMPHARPAVTAMERMPVGDGVACTATPQLDGRYVGTIECIGVGHLPNGWVGGVIDHAMTARWRSP